MSYSIRNIMPGILITALLNLTVPAQEPLQNSELVKSIEERVEGQIWLRKSETGDGLVSHVRMGSLAAKGSIQQLKQIPPVTELDVSIDPEEAELLAEFHQLCRLRIFIHGMDEGKRPGKPFLPGPIVLDEEPALPVLPNLEYLEISPYGMDVGPLMESVSRLPRLRHLTIYGPGKDASYGIKDKDLVWLKSVPLATLRTTNGLGTNSLEHIAEIKTIRTLIFEYADCKSSHLDVLNQLPRLTTLMIPGHNLDDSHFKALSTCVNGGEKPWRLAGSGGRLNRAAPKCSVVDFVIRWKAVIMAGFRVKNPEETSDAGVHRHGNLGGSAPSRFDG